MDLSSCIDPHLATRSAGGTVSIPHHGGRRACILAIYKCVEGYEIVFCQDVPYQVVRRSGFKPMPWWIVCSRTGGRSINVFRNGAADNGVRPGSGIGIVRGFGLGSGLGPGSGLG